VHVNIYIYVGNITNYIVVVEYAEERKIYEDLTRV